MGGRPANIFSSLSEPFPAFLDRGRTSMRSLPRNSLFLFARPWAILAVLLAAQGVVAAQLSAAPPEGTPPLHERIDQLIAAGCEARSIKPAGPADDAEFLRRIYLDLTGTIPTVGQAKAFLDDPSPIKRQQLIDRLLNSPEYARQMQRVFDVALMERRPAGRIPQAEWEDYLRRAFAANKPWNDLVREILAADGSDPALRPAARFVLDRDSEANLLTRDVGRLFLGRDMQCAQCHDHPLITDYLQADYYGLYAFLNRSFVFQPKDKKQPVVLGEKAEGDVVFKSVFDAEAGDQHAKPHLPGDTAIAEPTFEKGQEYAVAPADGIRPVPKFSRRAQLAETLPRAETAAFNRNIANRLWALMMGRGLVHPLDMDHSGNPPSHPELLDLLAEQFVAMNYDIKAMLRELALSQTYQRSSQLPEGVNELPADGFAVAPLKPLTAEQLALAIMQAVGVTDVQRGALGAGLNEQALYGRVAGNLRPFVSTFAGQPGQPEQDFQATLEQILFLSNGGTVRSWLSPQPGNLADRLNKLKEPAATAEELFLSVFTAPADGRRDG